MPVHPETIEGPRVVPWEPLGQIEPSKLPAPSEKYPGPWTTYHRGNGHMDVMDAQGRYFAHVYLWDKADWETLETKLVAAQDWKPT
jgi:hypothetical protein